MNGRIRTGAPVAFPVAFVGFMASGKTTLARLLGAELSLEVRDLDDEIIARSGLSIPEIFSTQGEPGFRKLEKAILGEWLAQTGSAPSSCFVLATGGGVVIDPENRDLLFRHSTCIFLDPPFETLYSRLSPGSPDRPLAWNRPYDELFRLWTQRRPWYLQTSRFVMSESNSISQNLSRILQIVTTSPS